MSEEKRREQPLALLSAIVERDRGDGAGEVMRRRGHRVVQILRGNGTAKPDLLSSLGLTSSRKDIVLCLLPGVGVAPLLGDLEREFAMQRPGSVAFAVDLAAIGGRKAYEYCLTGPEGPQTGEEEEKSVREKSRVELVVAIVNRGHSDEVMEAASAAGATGGTILHARGTGVHEAEVYLGVPIQPEKELVLILCRQERKKEIMTAILQGAGLATEGRGLVFSLPVSAMAGVSALGGAQYTETLPAAED